MEMRKYYEAYDDRYKQVHSENLRWFTDAHSPIVAQVVRDFGILPGMNCLEIGCGEGRDAAYLLRAGYDLLATDISPEAVSYCRKTFPQFVSHFAVLDCISQRLEKRFDFIYAVAVIHMLVLDEDRDGFYRFVYEQLSEDGTGLICTMGDGEFERKSDVTTAFDLPARIHEQSGKTVCIAGTSCRMVNFETFTEELQRNGLVVVQMGITSIEPDFPHMMFAVVKRRCRSS